MSVLKNLRTEFNRFCYKHRNKGLPNLMLYITIATAIVYVMNMTDRNFTLYYALCFDRAAILQGQIWRLFTFPFVYGTGNNLVLFTVSLLCYFSLGRAIENTWGTFRFNLFYLSGVLLMDAFCMIFGGWADAYHLNLSLFLAYATLYPDTHFLLFFIIPVKAWILAVVDLVLILLDVFGRVYGPFPSFLFPLVAIANYILFFGKDVANVFPITWRINASRLFKKKPKNAPGRGPIHYQASGSYQSATAQVKAPYTHKCTVCGRTDVSDPGLGFRYCSRCNGFHCYCEDHIGNHQHIE